MLGGYSYEWILVQTDTILSRVPYIKMRVANVSSKKFWQGVNQISEPCKLHWERTFWDLDYVGEPWGTSSESLIKYKQSSVLSLLYQPKYAPSSLKIWLANERFPLFLFLYKIIHEKSVYKSKLTDTINSVDFSSSICLKLVDSTWSTNKGITYFGSLYFDNYVSVWFNVQVQIKGSVELTIL